MITVARKLPLGAELVGSQGVHFRVWAPGRSDVEAAVENEDGSLQSALTLRPEEGGYFSGFFPGIGAGTLYRFRLDGGQGYPDPASRFQPRGPHGPSQVVDPDRFAWTDAGWPGLGRHGQVIYELHVGTFTPEGTWAGAARLLPELKELGITAVEIMPVADFPGKFGWGYDGVNLFAPTRLYGGPDDLRRFVDGAHALGLGVILDVVYNHFGPDGCYLREFSPDYFTDRHKNEWGEALNFDGPNSAPVRQMFVENAGYWISEYHLDGLRFDATQAIRDESKDHILAEIGRAARRKAGSRSIFLAAENEPQHTKLVRRPEEDGYGLDALWNDDFHHAAKVALTGHNEAYYSDYGGTPQEFISAVKWGYLYQGQYYSWQKQNRGTRALDLPPAAFINYLENHDQIANSGEGKRAWQLGHPGRHRALTALLLLAPATPLLFQGQEYGSSKPFLYFADHRPELAEKVFAGRRKFLSQFPSLKPEAVQALLADPSDPATFERCRLDPSERRTREAAIALHRDLLRLRRTHAAFRDLRGDRLHGAVLGPQALALRFLAEGAQDRLLVINLGTDLDLTHAPEPLLAPPPDTAWEILWSSEDPKYGGGGVPGLPRRGLRHLQGNAALLLHPAPAGTSADD